MPDRSKAQRRFMGAVKHDPAFAKRVGVPQSVGADFIAADAAKGKSYISKLPTRKAPVTRRSSRGR